ncbi:MAG: DNA-protecting protein DprA [Candidatus Nealsonbacteria bacterium CG_4_10_14_0_2_um_filter_40_15]|uniref:DNA-protecting protein DprA n=2 Tax=Candidatus Nealsoniibacteriota TaxID=1817911 RepID=A0A2M7D8D8_9BACT|nr:MAG: DNA-protecting protein DprA [Candidatus Nealsonbacteria bacterium CG02_land_8_20_14_3_00_40_11]PIZ87784.1 MAG: DNA-protecting protein DprA [Candidatus Nealsonbacteria bacterium CG_4_10_14_0_2_um_filter_40_15]
MENVITIKDKRYPELLGKIGKDAPEKIYYKGNWDSEIFKNCLAVVGSRRLTSYGRKITEQLVTEIASAGVTIVSGFMYGGDEAAHKAAAEAGGRTIAVMPCGIDMIHPEYQEELYNKILENKGLIISEYEGKFPPANWTYPRRNRIVAGLSKAVLIVEAGLNSGTLITAEFAKKFGRKIFAVPGPLTSEVSKGTAQLIKEGAEVVTEARDILKDYNISLTKPNLAKPSLNIEGIEQEIINQLQKEPLEADNLARILGMSVSKIGTTLSLMQLKGFINQEGGKYYVD